MDEPFQNDDAQNVIIHILHVSADFSCDEDACNAKTDWHKLEGGPLDIDLIVVECVELETISVLMQILVAHDTTALDVGEE